MSARDRGLLATLRIGRGAVFVLALLSALGVAGRDARADGPDAAGAGSTPPPPAAAAPGAAATAAATTTAAATATATTALPDARFSLDVLGGWQNDYDDTESAFFLKYQDIGKPFAVPNLFLRVHSWDTEYRLDMVDAGEHDAIYRFGVRRPGFFSASIGYDEIPDHYSDGAKTLYTASGDRLLIPDKIQTALQAQAFLLERFLRGHSHSVEIETDRKTARAKGTVSPLPGLTLTLQEEEETRRGNNSRSISTNFLNGADTYEFPDPIHYDTRRAGLGLEYRFGQAWVSVAAGLSRFSNRPDELLVDNPLRIDDAEGGPFGNRSSHTFLVSTPPDNKARDLSASAGVALPLGMRITATFASGRITAPADMIAYTSNSAMQVNPFFPSLPSSTIDAKVKTTRYDFAFTGTPLRWISFRVFARGYKYDNQTPSYLFPGYAIGDTQLSILDRRSLPYGWERKGEGFDLHFRPVAGLSVGAGFQRESVDRTLREVDSSDEDTFKINADYALMPWLEVHADVAKSSRTADHYDALAYVESYPAGVPGDQEQLRLLKRFDEASRDRTDSGLSGVVDFGSGWGLDLGSRQRSDDYVESKYGLVNEGMRNKIVGLTMKPNKPCELRVEVADEFRTRRVNERYRPLLAGQPVDARANDWSDELSDKIHTVTGGIVCRDEDERWDFNIWLDSSSDRQTDDAAFTAHAVFDPLFKAHARDQAPIKRDLQRINGQVRFDMSRHLDMVLRGLYEKLIEDDPTQDLMIPTMGNADATTFESAFLGLHYNSYSVRVFSLLVDAHW